MFTTRLMHQQEGECKVVDGPTLDRLMQCKISLNQKLVELRKLDEKILALVVDEDIESKIEQADQFTDRIQQTVFRIQLDKCKKT